jgi:dihydrofolate reductase
MRQLVLAVFVSLDGYIAGPGKQLVPPAWSNDMQRHWADANIDRAGVLLYGRVCFEGMAHFWQAAAADSASPQHDFAQRMAQLPKVVFSNTLTNPTWANTTVIGRNLADEVRKLKREPGKDLMLFGGARIAAHLMALGLIDTYRLMITPVVLGGGTRLFGDDCDRINLKRIDCRPLDTGAVILTYQTEPAVT